MRRTALLLLLCASASAQPLQIGAERALVAPRQSSVPGWLSFDGMATDGRHVVMAWTRNHRHSTSYVTFDGGPPKDLPNGSYTVGVVWSGNSYFVITGKNDGLTLIPVSREGTLGTPRPRAMREHGETRCASNGDGFVLVTKGRAGIEARLFDRNGHPGRAMKPVEGAEEFDVGATRGLYVITTMGKEGDKRLVRITLRSDGSRKVVVTLPEHLPRRQGISAAGDAVSVGRTLFIGTRELDLGQDTHSKVAWDGASYVVATATGLRRYSPNGELLGVAPAKHDIPLGIVAPAGKPTVVSLASEPAFQFPPKFYVNEKPYDTFAVADQSMVAASSDGTSAVVVWKEPGGLAATVFDPRTPEAPRRTIDLPGTTAASSSPAALSLGGIHYVVWRDESSIRLMRLDAHGTPLDRAPRIVATARNSNFKVQLADTPSLATNGRELFVAWPETNSVRATRVTLSGQAAPPLELIGVGLNYCFATHALFNGNDYVVFWIEQTSDVIYDSLPLFDIRSSSIHGTTFGYSVLIAKGVRYPRRLVATAGRLLWPEYEFPFYGPFPRPKKPEPSFLLLRTAALTPSGAMMGEPANTARLRRREWSYQPATDLSLLHDAHRHPIAIWSDDGRIVALPLDGSFTATGPPIPLGQAMTGTLCALPLGSQSLLFYTRRVGDVERVFFRTLRGTRSAGILPALQTP